jgi:hypothetical protein
MLGYSIQPIQLWVNGEIKTANFIVVSIVYDDLKNTATFYYQIIDQVLNSETGNLENYILISGNCYITGADYDTWGESDDINFAAYQYTCNKLNLTLIP